MALEMLSSIQAGSATRPGKGFVLGSMRTDIKGKVVVIFDAANDRFGCVDLMVKTTPLAIISVCG
jgi:hypothetical protein